MTHIYHHCCCGHVSFEPVPYPDPRLTKNNTFPFKKEWAKVGTNNPKKRNCDHKYHMVEGSLKVNNRGCPTWMCRKCGHKVISM